MLVSRRPDHPTPGVVTLEVSGEIDLEELDQFDAAIVQSATPGVSRVRLDLTGVTFMGSSGIRALLAAWRSLGELGTGLELGPRSDIVERVLDVTGVGRQLDDNADFPPVS